MQGKRYTEIDEVHFIPISKSQCCARHILPLRVSSSTEGLIQDPPSTQPGQTDTIRDPKYRELTANVLVIIFDLILAIIRVVSFPARDFWNHFFLRFLLTAKFRAPWPIRLG